MKKLFTLTLLLLCSIALYAQNDVTKFLGIPVDGTKEEMIQKLKAKGFRSNPYERDILEGEFNGMDVYVSVITNNNKVYRVAVMYANEVDETEIKIRFNHLCRQFENNAKYVSFEKNQSIPERDNISYEMLVHKKRYEAGFYQKSATETKDSMDDIKKRVVWFMIQNEYGKYRIIMFYDNEYNRADGEDL